MSAVSAHSARQGSASSSSACRPPRKWIISGWSDALFIILTPLVAAPAVLILYSSWVGITAETISLIVTAFFATGHHLPGLIRAYGDRDLFERFRWRFLLAPPLLFLAYFPLYAYHYDLYRLIILVWATWHALMQVYGFARIYDAKVGSISPATANWDWSICLCGFITPQLIREEHISTTLRYWYAAGGFSIPPWLLQAGLWGSVVISLAVLAGYVVHIAVPWRRGPKPSPLKLLILASGIGLWWFTMLGVENLLIGVALFDICHDVQYLAIVWLFNCRRVSGNAQLGRFMQYVFRRGMVLLYLGLITAYGAIAFVGPMVLDGTVSRIFYGVLFTSTILHYYYDGFIWKVREASNQAGLDLNASGAPSRVRQIVGGNSAHLLKWAPLILGFGLLFATDWMDPPLTTARKEELSRAYVQSLMGTPVLPRDELEVSWLYSQFEQTLAVAAAVPEDRHTQLRAAILLANFGRNDEAVETLGKILERHPAFSNAHLILGEIHLYRGNTDSAETCFGAALSHARTPKERSNANLKLGQIALVRHDSAAAEAKFAEALRDDPQLKSAIDRLRETGEPAETPRPGPPQERAY